MRSRLLLALLALVLVSCSQSTLLLNVQEQATKATQSVAPPTITPAGGVFRNAASVPAVTLATATGGARIFYTLDGSSPVYSSVGQNQYPTTNRADSPMVWKAGTLVVGWGAHPIRAVAWKDRIASSETTATFRIVGDGGTRWGVSEAAGQALAVARDTVDGRSVWGGWLTDASGHHGFVTEKDDSGASLWQATVASTLPTSVSTVTGVACDAVGNVYAVGTLSQADTYTFGPSQTLKVTSSVKTGYLAQYNPAGVCVWVIPLTSAYDTYCTGVAVSNAQSQVYVVGWVASTAATTMTLGSTTPGSAVTLTLPKNGTNGFVAWFSEAGIPPTPPTNPGFSASTGDTKGSDKYTAVAIDNTKNQMAVAGEFLLTSATTLLFGTPTVTGAQGIWNPMVVMANVGTTGGGGPVWARTAATNTADNHFTSVAISGGVIVAGGYQVGTASRTWGTTTQVWAGSSPTTNGVVAAYSASAGTIQWVTGIQGTGSSSINGVAIAPSGNVYAVGRAGSPQDAWNTATIGAPTARSPFLVQLNPGGGMNWVHTTLPGSCDAEYLAVTSDGNKPGTLPIAGTIGGPGSVDWGAGITAPTTRSGDSTLFLQAFD